jgi:hypothetical protein
MFQSIELGMLFQMERVAEAPSTPADSCIQSKS